MTAASEPTRSPDPSSLVNPWDTPKSIMAVPIGYGGRVPVQPVFAISHNILCVG